MDVPIELTHLILDQVVDTRSYAATCKFAAEQCATHKIHTHWQKIHSYCDLYEHGTPQMILSLGYEKRSFTVNNSGVFVPTAESSRKTIIVISGPVPVDSSYDGDIPELDDAQLYHTLYRISDHN